MAHQPHRALFTLLGFVIWGDLGPTTIYKNRKKKVVVFPKTWPKEPPSPAQTIQRDQFRNAAAAWRSLSSLWRAQWELATRRASLCMTGYDLFVHWHLLHDDTAIETLERQTGTALLPP